MDDQGMPDVGEKTVEDKTVGKFLVQTGVDMTLITEGATVRFYGLTADADKWLEENA